MDKEEKISLETYNDQINIWYKAHNIIREKTELYYDFVSSLLNLIDETYLGSDILVSEADIVSHYTWCYNKTTSNFEQEKIYFINKGGLWGYFWSIFRKSYYGVDNNEKYTILSDYFKLLFAFNKVKNPIELESFIEMYKILDQSLKKIN